MQNDRVRLTATIADQVHGPITRDSMEEMGERLRGAVFDKVELGVTLESRDDCNDLMRNLPVLKECFGPGGVEKRPMEATTHPPVQKTAYDVALEQITAGANRLMNEKRLIGVCFSNSEHLGMLRLAFDIWMKANENKDPLLLGKPLGIGDLLCGYATTQPEPPKAQPRGEAMPPGWQPLPKQKSYEPLDKQPAPTPARSPRLVAIMNVLPAGFSPDELDDLAREYRRRFPELAPRRS